MLQNAEQKGGITMAKSKDSDSKEIREQKQLLGKLIKECRGKKSLRSVAAAVGLPPSNLKYIEDGVNAPSPETYKSLVSELNPQDPMQKDMDRAYMVIRSAPPPDVCKVVTDNEELNDSLRIIKGRKLTPQQFQELNTLLRSFSENQ